MIAGSMGLLIWATWNDRDAARIVEQMIEGGVDLIQLRGKNKSIGELVDLAAELHELTAKSSTPLIVNDHAEIAARVPLEGVHVGQDDHSIEIVRQKAHHEILVGKSTHTLEQARVAQREGADYIGFGPIFATPTKPDYAPIGLEDIRCVHRRSESADFLHRRHQRRQSAERDRRRCEARCDGFSVTQGAQHC